MSDTFNNTSFEQLLNDDSLNVFDFDYRLPDNANYANLDTAFFAGAEFDVDAFTMFDPEFSLADVANIANVAEAPFPAAGHDGTAPLDASATASGPGKTGWVDSHWDMPARDDGGLQTGLQPGPVIHTSSDRMEHDVRLFFF
jgi:hypothetical protein